MPFRRILLAFALLSAALLTGCSSPSYTYRYVPGKTGTLVGGYVAAPEGAPERVKVAIAAANGQLLSDEACWYRYMGMNSICPPPISD